MKTRHLGEMKGGWFIGMFDPSLMKTDQFEVAVKHYKIGDKEPFHVHRIATEFTVIVSGLVLMNGETYGAGAIIEIPPGEGTDFQALLDSVTTVVKMPSVKGDKYARTDAIQVQFVDVMPETLNDGVLYVAEQFCLAIHKCACGCGQETVTPLRDGGWGLTMEDGQPTLCPSIGNQRMPCGSHYWVRKGRIEWA